MHLRQPGFPYSGSVRFTKNKGRIQKFKEKRHSRYIYQNELGEAWFRHDMAYEDFKDLFIRTACDKVLLDKAFNIAKNPKYYGYQKGLTLIVYKLFNKKSAGCVIKSETMLNQQLAEKLHKPTMKIFNAMYN